MKDYSYQLVIAFLGAVLIISFVYFTLETVKEENAPTPDQFVVEHLRYKIEIQKLKNDLAELTNKGK